jgi:hypothetical protein
LKNFNIKLDVKRGIGNQDEKTLKNWKKLSFTEISFAAKIGRKKDKTSGKMKV